MSIFANFDTHYGDGFYSGADHDGGLVGSQLSHEHGGGLYHGMPSVDGGMDILHGGKVVGHYHHDGSDCVHGHGEVITQHHDHATGIVETYRGGVLIDRAVPNHHGGMDHYDHDMHLHGSSASNGIGGEIIFDGNHIMDGTTIPNGVGAHDYLSFAGNADTIIGYQDPLAHAAEYQPHTFGFEHKF